MSTSLRISSSVRSWVLRSRSLESNFVWNGSSCFSLPYPAFSSFLLGFSAKSTKANIYTPRAGPVEYSASASVSWIFSSPPPLSPHRSLPRVSRRTVSDATTAAAPSSLSASLLASRHHRRREAPPARCTRSSRGLTVPVQAPSAQSTETLGIAGTVLRVPSPVAFLSSCRRWDPLPAPRAGGQDLRLLRLGLLVRLRRFSDPASPLPRVPHCRPLVISPRFSSFVLIQALFHAVLPRICPCGHQLDYTGGGWHYVFFLFTVRARIVFDYY